MNPAVGCTLHDAYEAALVYLRQTLLQRGDDVGLTTKEVDALLEVAEELAEESGDAMKQAELAALYARCESVANESELSTWLLRVIDDSLQYLTQQQNQHHNGH